MNLLFKKVHCTQPCDNPVTTQHAGEYANAAPKSTKPAYACMQKQHCIRAKQHLYVLFALFILCPANTCTAQVTDTAKIVNSLIKCWRATSYEYATIYGLEEEEIKKYAKQKVCLTRDSIVTYYSTLYNPRYAVKRVNAEDFAKNNFDCKKEKLGMIEDSVYEITISSFTKATQNQPAHKMTDIFAFDGYFVYMANDGVIFKLFDADAKTQGRSSN